MQYKRLIAISYGHFAIDILNSSVAIILTYLSAPDRFNLTVSQIGFGTMIYTFAAALTQPLFGLLADRLRGRWLAAIGLLWTMVFYFLAAFAPSYLVLITVLTIGALGSGAFHPVGIVNASTAGGRYPTTSTSVFFLLGQSGLALGPIVSGLVLQRMGMAGLPYIALAMTPALAMLAIYLRDAIPEESPIPAAAGETKSATDAATGRAAVGSLVLAAFVLVIALRATTLQAFMSLLPKYLADLGLSSGLYGLLTGVFVFSGALGTFTGGFLGDRFERRILIAGSLLLSVPFTYAMLNTGGWLFIAMTVAAGALLSIPHSILLIVGQGLLPRRKGLIGGAVLGFMFASGALTTWVASWFADRIGLDTVLTVLAFMPVLAAFWALFLPSSHRPLRRHPPQTSAPIAAD